MQHQRDILVVDDEPMIGTFLTRALSKRNYNVRSVSEGREALDLLRDRKFDLVITDLRMPEISGLDILKEVKNKSADIGVIVMSGFGSIEEAVESIKIGAYDFITKPFTVDRISKLTKSYFEASVTYSQGKYSTGDDHFGDMLGRSERMKEVFATIEQIAATDVTVFIQGPTGTGKEMVANSIQDRSNRKGEPFIKVNCAALPSGLMESELFGHVKGSFTGAIKDRRGIFESADNGTILLDEISEMEPGPQAKLLRVLQTGEIQRVGDEKYRNVNVRIIATTNRDIEQEIENGNFREDLYYRLNVVPIHLPALDEKREDIPLLSHYFVRRVANKYGKPELRLSERAVAALLSMTFPGNVRELENRLERAVVLCRTDELTSEDILENTTKVGRSNITKEMGKIPGTIEEAERELILMTLKLNNGNRNKSADTLGITVRTLRNKLNKYKEEGYFRSEG